MFVGLDLYTCPVSKQYGKLCFELIILNVKSLIEGCLAKNLTCVSSLHAYKYNLKIRKININHVVQSGVKVS